MHYLLLEDDPIIAKFWHALISKFDQDPHIDSFLSIDEAKL